MTAYTKGRGENLREGEKRLQLYFFGKEKGGGLTFLKAATKEQKRERTGDRFSNFNSMPRLEREEKKKRGRS